METLFIYQKYIGYLPCCSGCYEALGMASGAIPDENIVTSSGTGSGRPASPWAPTEEDDNPFIEVHFLVETEITVLSVMDGSGYDSVELEYTMDGEEVGAVCLYTYT